MSWNQEGDNPSDISTDTVVVDALTKLTEFYDPTSNYSLVETILTDPVFYKVELLLNLVDILEFDPFQAIQIDELEGLFYVNRILDYLTTAPGTATKVELIKVQ